MQKPSAWPLQARIAPPDGGKLLPRCASDRGGSDYSNSNIQPCVASRLLYYSSNPMGLPPAERNQTKPTKQKA